MTLDFETLRAILREDPEEFDRVTRAEIDKLINSAPDNMQQRLRGMQFIIDTKLNMTNSPVQRYNLMVEMFWDGFIKFRDVVNGIHEQANPGKVLQFRCVNENSRLDKED